MLLIRFLHLYPTLERGNLNYSLMVFSKKCGNCGLNKPNMQFQISKGGTQKIKKIILSVSVGRQSKKQISCLSILFQFTERLYASVTQKKCKMRLLFMSWLKENGLYQR